MTTTAQTVISDLLVEDVRFPTSLGQHGSDAMNPDPDYSAAYVRLLTNGTHEGNGLAFTLGRGTELCAAAARIHRRHVVGRPLSSIVTEFGQFWREVTSDSQLRWLGPDKGVTHMAAAAVVNAVWDLWAKVEGKPIWRLLADLSPEDLVRCLDLRYLSDVLTAEDALGILRALAPTREQRVAELRRVGYPAYTTSAGWLGYDDQRLKQLCRAAVEGGWRAIKLKVGANLERDRERLAIARQEIGPDTLLMVDANQVWEVDEAIVWMKALAEFGPYWIEEPTSPDDVLGHAAIARAIAPIGVATGEMAQNRVIFKQLLQSRAIRFCQVDSCRLGGLNEVLAVMLMARKCGVAVCPHGGGVGLCEHIQHLSIFDYVAISGELDDRWCEYVDHLHEHFVHPVVMDGGRYRVPESPGYGVQLKADSIGRYKYPDGEYWQSVK